MIHAIVIVFLLKNLLKRGFSNDFQVSEAFKNIFAHLDKNYM